MPTPLAVLAPSVGVPSETFIRRHMQDLAPGRTAVVTGTVVPAAQATWGVRPPLLALDSVPAGLAVRASRALGRKFGRSLQEPWLPSLRGFLEHHQVEVLLGEYLSYSLAFLPLARSLGCRFWAHAHGWDVSAALRSEHWRTGYLAYREATGVVTMSEFSRKRLIDLGLSPERIHTVHYGVEVPDEPPEREERAAVRCVAVGRMVSKKAPIITLAAFKLAADQDPTLHLDFVGGGELASAAEQFVRAYRLGSRVTLHGVQPADRVRQLMSGADLFLQHSVTDPVTGDEEGLPVAILEAMACGLPVVSTRHAGIPEAVVESETGLLVEEGDAHGMGDRLLALARDPDQRRAFGRAGWARARQRFTWEREKQDLARILGLPA